MAESPTELIRARVCVCALCANANWLAKSVAFLVRHSVLRKVHFGSDIVLCNRLQYLWKLFATVGAVANKTRLCLSHSRSSPLCMRSICPKQQNVAQVLVLLVDVVALVVVGPFDFFLRSLTIRIASTYNLFHLAIYLGSCCFRPSPCHLRISRSYGRRCVCRVYGASVTLTSNAPCSEILN